MSPARAALLLLADGRFPAGGYAHSGGLEESIRSGRVRDITDLEVFLRGRARTAGLVSAAFAAAGCHAFVTGGAEWFDALDDELDARMPSPTMRDVSRTLGRQMRRAVARIKPNPTMDGLGRAPHQPLVLGAAAAVFGAEPQDAAAAALHEAVTGPAVAAVRLLCVDPFDVHACLSGLTALLDELAAEAASYAACQPDDLPAASAPLLDVAAAYHRQAAPRLFAS